MKYFHLSNLVLMFAMGTMLFFGCVKTPESPSECAGLDEAQCSTVTFPNKSCTWLKSNHNEKSSCREVKSDCLAINSVEDCLAPGLARSGAICEFVKSACVVKRAASPDDITKDQRTPKNDGTKRLGGSLTGTIPGSSVPPSGGMSLIKKVAHCIDAKDIDACDAASNANNQACGWNNATDQCEEKQPPPLPPRNCPDYAEAACNQKADLLGNNCEWDNVEHKCKPIIVTAPSAASLGLCQQFETPEQCNESHDAQNNPCAWQRVAKECQKWRVPLKLRQEQNCRRYGWANLCNRGSDANNIKCLWNSSTKICEASGKPPLPPRDNCKDYRQELCDTSRDAKGNLCAFSVQEARCKTAAELAQDVERFGPFAFRTLKAWTDTALSFNEALIDSAQRSPEMQMTLAEFDLALLEFAKMASVSKLKDANLWLAGNLPINTDFFTVSDLGQDNQSRYQDVDFFAEKQTLPTNARIVVMGDFHGSLHSLIRNLWRLHAYGYLRNDFKLEAPHVHLVFTGDFIDRGRYGAETLYTLLRLKIANFDQVHLVRGNHEDMEIATRYGFLNELQDKFGYNDGDRAFRDAMAAVRFLPIVYFASVGDGAKKNVLHFSHGGFSYNHEAGVFLHEPKTLLDAKDAAFELLPAGAHLGYQWSDFEQNDDATASNRGIGANEGVVTAGVNTFKTYAGNNGIRAIFRGHQDMGFALKMLFNKIDTNDRNAMTMLEEAQRNTINTYPNGPFHWTDVVADREAIEQAAIIGIRLAKESYAPVFTFTTAVEARQMLYDGFGIIKAANDWNDFRMEVHEVRLPNDLLGHYRFVNIAKANDNDDGINVNWSLEGPGRCYLNP